MARWLKNLRNRYDNQIRVSTLRMQYNADAHDAVQCILRSSQTVVIILRKIINIFHIITNAIFPATEEKKDWMIHVIL